MWWKVPTGVLGVFALLLALPFFFASGGTNAAAACRIDPAIAAAHEPVAGFADDQLANAAAIMTAGAALGAPPRAQQIAVMTAIEEATLRNLTYGDNAINPDGTVADSVGLFQQQGSWGTLAERMDPATAAGFFYERLLALDGWQDMAPEDAAHAIQVNDRADRYAEHWDDALSIVDALTRAGGCTTGFVSAGGGGLPSAAPITSDYGLRVDPISGESKPHLGVDFSGGCGTPIWAAADGVVTRIFTDQWGGWIVEVDHGGGALAWYVHSYANGIFVQEDDVVAAGQQIAEEGSSGYSTGCHLHFEVRVDGQSVDPLDWLASRGVAVPVP